MEHKQPYFEGLKQVSYVVDIQWYKLSVESTTS